MTDKDKELGLELYSILEEMMDIATAGQDQEAQRGANRRRFVEWLGKMDEGGDE